jgi:hypothetical protein
MIGRKNCPFYSELDSILSNDEVIRPESDDNEEKRGSVSSIPPPPLPSKLRPTKPKEFYNGYYDYNAGYSSRNQRYSHPTPYSRPQARDRHKTRQDFMDEMVQIWREFELRRIKLDEQRRILEEDKWQKFFKIFREVLDYGFEIPHMPPFDSFRKSEDFQDMETFEHKDVMNVNSLLEESNSKDEEMTGN